MSKVCILTDNTVQFPIPAFEGRNLVRRINLHVEINGQLYTGGDGIKAADLPVTLKEDFQINPVIPSVKEIEETFLSLGQHFDHIFAILHTSSLSPLFKNASQAAKNIKGEGTIDVIDSQMIGTGLGLIVQKTAAFATQDTSIEEIEYFIRGLLPQIFGIFCIQGLSYLHNNGKLDPAQAKVAEIINMLPLYVLEGGGLTPTQKARNRRHLVDLLHEFIEEFFNIEHIGFIQGVPPFETETRTLRERLALDFEGISISEHTINTVTASILGPRSLGVFVLEGE